MKVLVYVARAARDVCAAREAKLFKFHETCTKFGLKAAKFENEIWAISNESLVKPKRFVRFCELRLGGYGPLSHCDYR